jgi:hypothetical protein
MLCAACLCLGSTTSFGAILINLDATGLPVGELATWTNSGSLAGDFVSDGGAIPLVTNVAGINAVGFVTTGGADGAGSTHYVGPIAPPEVTGGNSRSIEAWIYNPSAQPEEVVFAWGRRNGVPDGSNVSFNHGTDPAFGAVGHWGAPDIGWNSQITFNAWTHIAYTWDAATRVTRVYRDGVQVNVESNITLNTHSLGTGGQPLRFRVARQSGGTGTPSGTGVGEIIIAKVRAYDAAMSPAAVQASYSRERCAFTNDVLCADDDNDGIPNGYEVRFPGCLSTNNAADASADCDGDGLNNLQEYQNGTLADNADSDGDGINDGAEVNRMDGGVPARTDPLAADSDNDGLRDNVETDTGVYVSATDTGTDPLLKDTDGDTLSDRVEVTFSPCLNPNNPADAAGDCDSDGLTNLQESQLGTIMINPDTDGDGLNDGAEVNRLDGGVAAPTNPLRADTDGDGLADGAETDTGVYVSLSNTGTDPLVKDSDGDSFNDLHELVRGTNPNSNASLPNLADPALSPLINLDATVLNPGPLPSWTNGGALGGTFTVGGEPPAVNTIQNIRGVTLNGVTGGNQFYTGQDAFNQSGGPGAPNFLVGSNSHTVEAWIFNPDAVPEETIFAWGRRGGGPDGSNMSFNHGTDGTFGAVGHWGAGPDIGWANAPTGGVAIGRWTFVACTYVQSNGLMSVYKDGVLANSEVSNPRLNVHEFSTLGVTNRLRFRVGSQNEANGTPTGNLRGGLTVARVRVYEVALDAAAISNKFSLEADAFGVVDTDNDGLPTWYERLYPACLNPNDPSDVGLDCDSDGATNLLEYLAGTLPNVADTDGDGINDGAELNRTVGGSPAPTNPLRADTDQDGLPDNVETGTGTYVSRTDTGSNPLVPDSDGDGFSDGQEVLHDSDPNNAVITPDFEFTDPLAIINLDATGLSAGALATWTNNGALGGVFTAGGLAPSVTTVANIKGVTLDGTNDFYNGPVAPVFLTSSNSRTIQAWIYNPEAADEETIFNWGRRGGPDGANMSFNHGLNATFGAAGHWGAGPDMGWNGNLTTGRWTFVAYTYDKATLTTAVYRDGQLANTETNILLNTHSVDTSPGTNQLPFRVGAQTDAGGTPTVGLRGSMTIARLRVYDEALSAGDILAQYNAEASSFAPARPRLSIQVDRNTGNTTITWDVASGRTYAVETSPDLVTWSPRATGLSTGNFVDNQTAGVPIRFYRIREE